MRSFNTKIEKINGYQNYKKGEENEICQHNKKNKESKKSKKIKIKKGEKSEKSKKSKKFLLGVWVLSTLLLSPAIFALQQKAVTDNGTVQAFASTRGLTRIAVAHDRISNVRGPGNTYSIQNDNAEGAVFIQLAPTVKHPFTLFIATEQGHNYVLRLTPRAQNADTILLKPLDSKDPEAQHWETASPYTEVISDLMRDMVTNASPEGYAVNSVVAAPLQHLGNMANLKLKKVYAGAYLEGEVYELTNRTTATLRLTEREFYQAGDRAIALSSLIVPPQGTTWVYKVKSHGQI